MNIAIILLAAGGSTRLGSPKQRLAFHGKTLLRHAAENALATGCRPALAILGSGADALRGELAGLDITALDNPNWANGMGTSVRLGVAALPATADAALLMLCDQPLVTAEKLSLLVAAFRLAPDAGLAAAAYHDTVGVPAVFSRAHFGELLALPDDAGAKPVLRRHRQTLIAVPLPEAAIDIDTREQYERLTGS